MDGWSWDGLTDLTLSPSSRGLLSTDGVLERTLNETFATAVVVEAASERSSERERERERRSEFGEGERKEERGRERERGRKSWYCDFSQETKT